MSTFKVTVVLAYSAVAMAASTPQEGATRVEILDANGNSLAFQDSGYVFTGLLPADYIMRAQLLDVNGSHIGAPYLQQFSIVESTREIQLPSGATINVEPE